MIVPGYAVLLITRYICIIQENRALRPDEKTACSSSCAAQQPAPIIAMYYYYTSPGNNKENVGGRGETGWHSSLYAPPPPYQSARGAWG
jgi:hypothetical protein